MRDRSAPSHALRLTQEETDWDHEGVRGVGRGLNDTRSRPRITCHLRQVAPAKSRQRYAAQACRGSASSVAPNLIRSTPVQLAKTSHHPDPATPLGPRGSLRILARNVPPRSRVATKHQGQRRNRDPRPHTSGWSLAQARVAGMQPRRACCALERPRPYPRLRVEQPARSHKRATRGVPVY